jgi:hypothetical protein
LSAPLLLLAAPLLLLSAPLLLLAAPLLLDEWQGSAWPYDGMHVYVQCWLAPILSQRKLYIALCLFLKTDTRLLKTHTSVSETYTSVYI